MSTISKKKKYILNFLKAHVKDSSNIFGIQRQLGAVSALGCRHFPSNLPLTGKERPQELGLLSGPLQPCVGAPLHASAHISVCEEL